MVVRYWLVTLLHGIGARWPILAAAQPEACMYGLRLRYCRHDCRPRRVHSEHRCSFLLPALRCMGLASGQTTNAAHMQRSLQRRIGCTRPGFDLRRAGSGPRLLSVSPHASYRVQCVQRRDMSPQSPLAYQLSDRGSLSGAGLGLTVRNTEYFYSRRT
jgi:hypothetical protein